jgi:pimeloyl-ACP methyl ester carboxylesterase
MWTAINPRMRAVFRLSKSTPFMLSFLFKQMVQLARTNPLEFVRQAVEPYAKADQLLILKNEEMAEMIVESYIEGFRQGTRAAVHEASMIAQPWGFRLGDIRARVFLWHGQEDTETPLVMGRYLADAIPGCQATFMPDEGHFSVMARCLPDIMAAL